MANGFDDSGGLLFITLVGISAATGVLTTELLGIDGPGGGPLLVAALIGLLMLGLLQWVCVIFDPFGARALLVGEDNA